MVGRATDGAGQQMDDAFLKNRVGLETDGVLVALGFQELIVSVRGLYESDESVIRRPLLKS